MRVYTHIFTQGQLDVLFLELFVKRSYYVGHNLITLIQVKEGLSYTHAQAAACRITQHWKKQGLIKQGMPKVWNLVKKDE